MTDLGRYVIIIAVYDGMQEALEVQAIIATIESIGSVITGGLAGGEFFPVYIIFDSTCMWGDSLIKIELGGYRYPAVLVYWNRPDGTRRYFLEIRDLSLRRDDFEEGQSLAIQKQ